MALSSSSVPESGSRHHSYSRKQKSLGLLCTNFLSLYDREDVESIGLDAAASRLGVERRRIYDIVNVLESVGVLARKAKNQYSWKGFGNIPKTLQELKEEGLRENFNTLDGSNFAKISDDEDDERSSNPNTGSQKSSASSKNVDSRREKSLGLLTQNFVKLFLCSNVDVITLDEAAKILLGDTDNSIKSSSAARVSNSAAKVRRLYDIANVLSSMNLIEKTHYTDSRKPGFRWLGIRGKPENAYTKSLNPSDSKKRAFGTEITNTDFKRNKFTALTDENFSNQINKPMPFQVKSEQRENGGDWENSEHDSKQNHTKSYKFGPFAPVNVIKVSAPEKSSTRRVQDWESLASTYRPQYHNQALKDLFTHYVEAYTSWLAEVDGEKPVQEVS